MYLHKNCIKIFILCLTCCGFLFLISKNLDYQKIRIRNFSLKVENKIYKNFIENNNLVPIKLNSTSNINDILDYQRQQMLNETKNFEFPNSSNLFDFVPETGGTPKRSIIITTWRSGSTFFGDILNSVPGNFYHFEPLAPNKGSRIRGPPNDAHAINIIKQLLMCNYTNLTDYLSFAKKISFMFKHNTRLWNYCRTYPKFCYNRTFIEPFCKIFPFQSMKVIRMNLAVAKSLLEDQRLNVRMVYLVRDPRGVLQSRKHHKWCKGKVECGSVRLKIVCQDLIMDYNEAKELSKKYSQTFKVLRYEDLSISPYNKSKELLEFYGLPFDKNVQEFLDTHTRENKGDAYSTFRDSKITPFKWLKKLSFDKVESIQQSCRVAMKMWGYKEIDNPKDLSYDFNPILPFHL